MKKSLTVLLLLCTTIVQGTDYFISNNGNDQHACTSPALAWQTLSKVQSASATLQPGDRIFFRKGDTFHGQLNLKDIHGTENNLIVIGAYGLGQNPVLDGSVKVTGWTKDQGKIWVANTGNYHASQPVKGVYFDEQMINKARHPNLDAPNQGYLTEDVGHGYNDRSVIKDHDLPKLFADHDWQGAEVVARTREYLLDISLINRHTDNTLYLTKKLTYGMPKGFGYFFQNSYKALDQHQEWYYDPASQKLYIYLDKVDPNDHTIEIAYHDTVLGLALASYVKIENLTIQKGRSHTVSFDNLHHCYFSSNQVLLSAENGLKVTDTELLTIENNTIDHTQNNALELTAHRTIIQDNEIRNTATVAGMGTTGNGQYIACFISGKDNVFRYNKVINTGYNAVHFDSGPWIIEKNLIDHFNMVKNDGGGIYCFQNNEKSKVLHNIILHGGGSEAGAPLTLYPKDRGLYADGGSSQILYQGNTIAYCGEGMLINSGNSITVTHNTFAGNRSVSLRAYWYGKKKAHPDSRNIIVKDNIFIAANDYYPIYAIETQKNDRELFGTFDENILSQPLSSSSPKSPYIFYTKEDIGFPGKGNLDYQYYNHLDLKGWTYGSHDDFSTLYYDRFMVKATEANLVTNSNMNTSFPDQNSWLKTNTSSPNFKIERVTKGGIDGSSLRAKFSNSASGDQGSVVQKGIAVTKDAYYQVAFDMKGSISSTIIFKFVTGCCGKEHTAKPFPVNTTATHYQFIFKADETTDEGRIFINLKAANDEVYFDNITIQKVMVEEVKFDDIVKLEYNASKQPKTIELRENYLNIDGSPVHGTISLPPYESRVLFKSLPSLNRE